MIPTEKPVPAFSFRFELAFAAQPFRFHFGSQWISAGFAALQAQFAEVGFASRPPLESASSDREAVFDRYFLILACTLRLDGLGFVLEMLVLFHFAWAIEDFVNLAKSFDFGYL